MFKRLSKLFQREDSHEFKPLLAEIEDRPASPLARVTFWIVLAVFLFGILWMFLGEVDVVVTGRGKISPKGNVKVLQPLETGVIKAILVEPGDYVQKGQPLIVIDTSMSEPELETAESNLKHLQIERDRLLANVSEAPFSPSLQSDGSLASEDLYVLETQQQLYASNKSRLQAQLLAKQEALSRIEAQIQETEVEAAQNRTLLSQSKDKAARLEAVLDIIAKKDYEEVQQDILNYQKALERLDHRRDQLAHQQNEILEEMASIEQNAKTDWLSELSEKQMQISQLQAKREGSAFVHARHQIAAPVDGYVNELFVHTVGGVVTPAEKLVSVIPANQPLIVQAFVGNRDIGFVREGLPVSIKVDTFSFQKYGTLQGEVTHISKDSRARNAEPDQPKEGGEPGEPVYEVTIKPLEHSLLVEGVKQPIKTGMTVNADIKVGKRKIIEFFVYPLIKYLNEGMSVR